MVFLAWYRDESDWAAVRKVCLDPDSFGESYKDFIRSTDRRTSRLESEGRTFSKVEVRPGEFALWCAIRKLMPSRVSLEDYVADCGAKKDKSSGK